MKSVLRASALGILTIAFVANGASLGMPDLESVRALAVPEDTKSSAASDALAPAPTEQPPTAPPTGNSPPPEIQKEMDRSRAQEAKARALREAATTHPEEVRYQVEWLEGLLDINRVEEGLDLAPALIEKFPHSAELFAAYGRHLLRDGQFDLAGVQFQRAVSEGGDTAKTRSLIARAEIIKGNLQAAEVDLKKALALDPKNVEAHQMLAFLYERTGRYAEAVAEMKDSGSGRRTMLQRFVKEPPMELPAEFAPVTAPFIAARGFPPAIKIQIAEGVERLFVIDTASEDISITAEAAGLAGLPAGEGAQAKEGSPAPPMTYAILPSVKLGHLVVKRVPVRIVSGLRYPDPQIAGALGRSFLRSFRVLLDYPSQTVTLSKAGGPPLGGVPFDLASVILLEGFNGDKAVGRFVLDSSSYTPGALDAEFVARETGLTMFSEEVKKIPSGPYLFTFTMPSLKVGGVEFTKFPATAVDLRMMSRQLGINVRGVVGNSLLKQCRLEIDFKNQRLSLEKVSASGPVANPGGTEAPTGSTSPGATSSKLDP